METLSTQQLAELTGYHVQTIQKMVRDGDLPAMRVPNGKKYIFDKKKILELLGSNAHDKKPFDLD